MANVPILSFSGGEASPLIDARADVAKYSSLCRHLENMIPRIYGSAERRPGTYYINSSYNDTATIRLIPFIYSASVAYVLEFGNYYIRVFYDGSVITTISSPYKTADLFELCCGPETQVGDVMWIAHPNYAQRKLSRTSPTDFELDKIDFRNGPFLTRNDLLDPDNPNLTTLQCTATVAGDYGSLIATTSVFLPEHIGALFKLIHPRVNTIITCDNVETTSALLVKGAFSFNMQRTDSGDVILQRRENSISSNDWEDYRTWGGDYSRNIQFSATEDADNVEYRINSSAADLSATITVHNNIQEGIVKVLGVGDMYNCIVQVYSALASTNTTQRWAEGSWSAVRGYPATVTFYKNRCVYAGAASGSLADTSDIEDYPNLLNLTF